MPNQTYNFYINSKNRIPNEKTYDFNVYLQNQIVIGKNQGINVNVMSFSMLNSMYNVNQITQNNTFVLEERNVSNVFVSNTTITIPYGNYSVYTLRDTLNSLLSTKITVAYNPATNTYTFKNIKPTSRFYFTSLKCSKLLGISTYTEISTTGTTGKYIDMVNYQQIILKCPTLLFDDLTQDNINDKDNIINISQILFWVNKQDVEPFKTINYNNEDGGSSFSYNVKNENITSLNFKMTNENDEPIEDASDFLLQLKMTVFDKNENFDKSIATQTVKFLDDINFTLLNILFNNKGKKNILYK